jgi:hypothetical protein
MHSHSHALQAPAAYLYGTYLFSRGRCRHGYAVGYWYEALMTQSHAATGQHLGGAPWKLTDRGARDIWRLMRRASTREGQRVPWPRAARWTKLKGKTPCCSATPHDAGLVDRGLAGGGWSWLVFLAGGRWWCSGCGLACSLHLGEEPAVLHRADARRWLLQVVFSNPASLGCSHPLITSP